MSEFVRVRKDDWDALRRDIEVFIQHYEASLRKVKDLMKENASLREQIRTATEKLAMTDQKASVDIQQTTAALQGLRANISHAIQETEEESKD